MLIRVLLLERADWENWPPVERLERYTHRNVRLSVAFLVLGWAMNLVWTSGESMPAAALAGVAVGLAGMTWLRAAWLAARLFELRHRAGTRTRARRLLGANLALGLLLVAAGAWVGYTTRGDAQPLFIGLPSAGVALMGVLVAVGIRCIVTSVSAWGLLSKTGRGPAPEPDRQPSPDSRMR